MTLKNDAKFKRKTDFWFHINMAGEIWRIFTKPLKKLKT